MWPLLLLNLVKLQAAPNGEFHPREETAKLWTQTVCEETPENSKNAEEIKSCCKQPKTRKGTWNIKLTLRPLIMFPGEESYTYPYSHRYLKDVFTVAQKSSNSIFKETKRKNRRRKKQTPKSATLKNIYELHRTNFERSHLISSAAAQQGPLTHVISRINRCDIFPVIIGPVSSYSLNRVIPFTSLFLDLRIIRATNISLNYTHERETTCALLQELRKISRLKQSLTINHSSHFSNLA
ncbi:Oidioi.mRNA.OKI2018_I69.XSR.g15617.t1.cds [Oikopleura dioica]|uniref:Oidioi.mRNA.OKI2018_I69.XSR.g15617.t1.cds n=1 Tax=Oikopleura dioica TaxID=34765 RepID=A0ABN7SDF5_OIKDI|nr:Oidioi.mRNA.OKI2018_I69.XSR.g15617.t1.cds [Oikopleura dioica]